MSTMPIFICVWAEAVPAVRSDKVRERRRKRDFMEEEGESGKRSWTRPGRETFKEGVKKVSASCNSAAPRLACRAFFLKNLP
jgi:hypothetical protein